LEDGKPDYTLGDLQNEMLISGGAPKEKYSRKVTKVRIARPEDLSPEQLSFIKHGLNNGKLYLFLVKEHSKPPKYSALSSLSSKQMNIIKLLMGREGSITELKKYGGLKKEEVDLLMEDEYYKRLCEDHIKNITEAIRGGLIWHPWIFEFVYTYKALGDKKILRQIKRGLETGVKRPLTINDIKFESYVDRITKYKDEGKTWKVIRRTLRKRKIIGKMTLPGLQKKYKKACEEAKAPSHFPLIVLIPPPLDSVDNLG